MTRFIPLTAAAVFIGGAMAASAADFREIDADASMKLAEYEPTGASKTCVSSRQVKSMSFIDDRLILVEMNNGEQYVNRPAGKCKNTSRGNFRIEYMASASRICKGEIIKVVENTSHILMGTCSLGDFQEFEKPADS